MKNAIVKRAASVLAVAFSLLTIIEGSLVLLTAIQPHYAVLKPLVLYNLLMAFAGVVGGVVLWIGKRWGLALAATLAVAHLVVLGIVAVMHYAGGDAALQSVQAMAIRAGVWLGVSWSAWSDGAPVVNRNFPHA